MIEPRDKKKINRDSSMPNDTSIIEPKQNGTNKYVNKYLKQQVLNENKSRRAGCFEVV